MQLLILKMKRGQWMSKGSIFRYVIPILIAFVMIMPIIANPANVKWYPRISKNSMGPTNKLSPSINNLKIYIVYDGTNPYITRSAKNLYFYTRSVIPSTKLIDVYTVKMLKNVLRSSTDRYVVYFFNTTLSSIRIGFDEITLQSFANLLESYCNTTHILAIGNTEQLSTFLRNKSKIYYNSLEYADIKVIEIGALWNLANALEENAKTSSVGSSLRKVAIKAYCENLKELISVVIEPSVIIGMEDIAKKREMFLKRLAEMPKTLRKVKPLSSNDRAAIDFIFEGNSDGTKVEFMSIPLKSGLDGPIGKVLDLLLDVLIENGAKAVGLDVDIIEGIIEILHEIYDVVGSPENLGVGTALMDFLKTIGREFPFIDQYAEYYDFLINAIFALRGDTETIIDTIISAIDLVYPEATGTIEEIKSLVQTIIRIEDLPEVLTDAEKLYDVLATWLNQRIINETVEKFLNELSLTADKISQMIDDIVNYFNTIISFFTENNLIKFISDLRDKLIQESMNLLTSTVGKETLNKIMNITELVLIAFGYSDTSLKTVIRNLILSFVDVNEIQNELDGLENMIEDIMDKIDTAIKEGWTAINQFYNEIKNTVDTYLSTTEETVRELLAKAITLGLSITNKKFDLSQLQTITTLSDIIYSIIDEYISDNDVKDAINKTVVFMMALYAKFNEYKELYKVISGSIDNFESLFGDPVSLILDFLELIFDRYSVAVEPYIDQINNMVDIGYSILKIVFNYKEATFQSILEGILADAGYALIKYYSDDLGLGNYTAILRAIFYNVLDFYEAQNPEEALNYVLDMLGSVSTDIKDNVSTVMEFIIDIRDVFHDGIRWLINKILDWATEAIDDLVESVLDDVQSLFKDYIVAEYDGEFSAGFGSYTFFELYYDLKIETNLEFDEKAFRDFVSSIISHGLDWELGDIDDIFLRILSFFKVTPIFSASLEVSGLGSEENKVLSTVLTALGLEMKASGKASIKLQLFSFSLGSFDVEEFLKVLEWTFSFSIEISKTFTLIDFITGGVGGGVVSDIAEYIGLDAISIKVYVGILLEIAKRATSTGAEQATFLLELTLGAKLDIGIDVIVAELSIYGSIEIILRIQQDLLSESPFTLTITGRLELGVEIDLPWPVPDIEASDDWELFSYQVPSETEHAEKYEMGLDADGDGLSDDYEMNVMGLSPENSDTDGDGISDKEETYYTHTDPLNPDSDMDGLNDYEEIFQYSTDPLRRDTDYDGLSDYEEVAIYGTDPLNMDTDQDGLDDNFEVNYHWDMSQVVPSVTSVFIGGVEYHDHTDPLNPDTDGDGLLDGEEGPLGGYYGAAAYDYGDNPIIFNYGYTHPLDNDTDDDSYRQLSDGSIAPGPVFLRSMTDKEEIDGIPATLYEDGQPVPKLFHTNPVCPDTDQDSSGLFLNSDGYELALDPPSDPLDGDSDDDGLIDGAEGVGSDDSNHTHYLMPDTDGDGLWDLDEILLGTNPRVPDTDGDMVSDGDEVHKFHTDPLLNDSDFDGLYDGEELFFWHCSPLMKDSDADGLSDSDEVLHYFTDPMDEDSDNDELTDKQEIFIFLTDPNDPDTDDDELWDYDEIFYYNTNPLNWDSDSDSIVYPNEYGEMTWPMSDGDEILRYGTNPLFEDTDHDGLSDGYELYLASGIIPNFTPIPLDPSNNDTDGDGILDGAELRILNISDIVYPYVSLEPFLYYNSSPVMFDTDNDGLNDSAEIFIYGTLPYCNDSDNDTLSDYDELMIYHTNPMSNDTDGDGLYDFEETIPGSGGILRQGIYESYANDEDSDDDLLPDGYEVFDLGTNPRDPDENNNGIRDGYEYDADNDGLSDGEELFIYNTAAVPYGGIYNPDSDVDGISDGIEVYVFGTDPANNDTDGDGFGDGAEVSVGTDPLTPTSEEEYLSALLGLLSGKNRIVIISPRNGTLIDFTSDVRVVNATPIKNMWFRYREIGSDEWSDNISLTYDPASYQWVYSNITWNETSYEIEVYGETYFGLIYVAIAKFSLGPAPTEGEFLGLTPSEWTLVGYGAVAGAGAAVGVLLMVKYNVISKMSSFLSKILKKKE